jgi:hypothetical protein
LSAHAVATVTTRLGIGDRLGRWVVRWGIRRGGYRAKPGLYKVGRPDPASPVLVTANYKLTLDALRSELEGVDAWILVLDTKEFRGSGIALGNSEVILHPLRTSPYCFVMGESRPQSRSSGCQTRHVSMELRCRFGESDLWTLLDNKGNYRSSHRCQPVCLIDGGADSTWRNRKRLCVDVAMSESHLAAVLVAGGHPVKGPASIK